MAARSEAEAFQVVDPGYPGLQTGVIHSVTGNNRERGYRNEFSRYGARTFPDFQRLFGLSPVPRLSVKGQRCRCQPLLLYDMEIDFIVFTGGSRTSRYGVDFFRNITSNLEVHGEFSYIEDFQKRYIDSNGNILTSTYDTVSYLLGIRYLSQQETTYILEYYRNGTGFTKSEFQDFYWYVDRAYDSYLTTGSDTLIKRGMNLSQGNYARPNPMGDYLYLRVSQKEPFDVLYFTPALTAIVNLNDQSFSISPEVSYTGITNLELRLKATFLVGGGDTEFGEKPNDYRLEFRARYFF